MKTLEAPYYAVIFRSRMKPDAEGYCEMAARMEALAAASPGYLGFESARGEDGFGLAVSYWESEDAITQWKANADHQLAQTMGRNDWYEDYDVRIAKVERAYSMTKKK